MPLDLQVLAVLVGLMLLVGVPVIRASVRVPRELDVHLVGEDELTPAQREHYARIDLRVAPAWTPRFNFAVTNLPGPTLSRVYLGDHSPAFLAAHCLRSASVIDENVISAQNYLEWITRFEDGGSLATRNAQAADLFDLPPGHLHQALPGVGDPLALEARHSRRVAELNRAPLSPHGRDLTADFAQFHRSWGTYQLSRGLLRPSPSDGEFRPTTRTALRGVAVHLNPLADNFTLPRFALGLLLGLGVPLLATWAVEPSALGRPDGFPVVDQGGMWQRLVFLGTAYGLAGAAVGVIFQAKSFIWAALLGYLPMRLLTPVAGPELLLALWMAAVAEQVSRFLERRRALV